jgi:hypothetical protein
MHHEPIIGLNDPGLVGLQAQYSSCVCPYVVPTKAYLPCVFLNKPQCLKLIADCLIEIDSFFMLG